MLNSALYRREMRRSVKLLALLAAVMSLYIVVIIGLYDPHMTAMLDDFVHMMPELMAAVGMHAGNASLLDFMISYLYGFILLLFPMLFSMLRGNGLVAKYVDDGSMVALMAAPVKRRTIVLTQAAVLISGLLLLLAYATALEMIAAAIRFPGEINPAELLRLNGGLLCLHLFISGICFLASCACPDARSSIGLGVGVPTLMVVLQMLANVGGAAEQAKYFTFFTLFDPTGVAAGSGAAMAGVFALLAGAVVLYAVAVEVFRRKDLPI